MSYSCEELSMSRKLIALAVIVAGFSAPIAFAGDVKLYNGSVCQASDGSDEENFDKNPVSGIENESDSSYGVTCPVVRDEELTTQGLNMAVVFVHDGDDNGSVLCCLYSNTSTGSLSRSRCSTTGSAYVGDTVLGITVGAGYVGGNYAIQCSVPPDSRITSYKVDERPEN
jgi:hypothetical protein